jgi:hypothetical protein
MSEIYKKTETKSGGSEIIQNLCSMLVGYLLYRLDFHYYLLKTYDIGSVCLG